MTKKLVIFDLDNTLVITRPAAKIGYKQAIYYLARIHNQYQNRDKLYNHWKRLVQTLQSESDPSKRQFAYSLSLLLKAHNIPETNLDQALNIFERELLNHLELMPGAKDTLTRLNKEGHLVIISTATYPGDALKKLKHVNLRTAVSAIFTSSEVGIMKPHVDYYRLPIAHYKIPPTRTLVVGDDSAEDLTPAQAFGCQTLLINGPQTHLSLLFEKYGPWLSQ